MFKNIRSVLDRYEKIVTEQCTDNISNDDEFIQNIELYLAIAIRSEFSDCVSETLGKVLCDMKR